MNIILRLLCASLCLLLAIALGACVENTNESSNTITTNTTADSISAMDPTDTTDDPSSVTIATEPNETPYYASTAQEAVLSNLTARYKGDYKMYFASMGIVWDECFEFGEKDSLDDYNLSIGNVRVTKKLVGDEYGYFLNKLADSWLNNSVITNNYGFQFVYSASDVKQVSYVSVTITEQDSGESRDFLNAFPVVQTDKGWFVASVDL